MQIVIEIPEIQKKMIDLFVELPPQVENDLISAIRHGTPLPEHHGRLIDADELLKQPMDLGNYPSNYVRIAKTIIPATKEKSCKNCKYGKAYEHGADITTMDDECGGCCSWNDKWTPKQTPTEEKSCKNCEHGFDSEDCYKCDKNIQNTCEPKQTATKEECALTDCKRNDNGKCTDGLAYRESCYDCYQPANCATCGQPRDYKGQCILFKEGRFANAHEKWKPVTKAKEGE